MISPLANRSRLERLLADAGVEALVASSAENVTYLSDYWSLSHWARRSSHAYAVFVPGEPTELVVPLGNADLLAADWIAEPGPARTYGEFVAGIGAGRRRSPEADAFAAAITGELPHHGEGIEAAAAALGDRASGASRIALESAGLPAGGWERFAAALPDRTELVEAARLIRSSRAVKTPREIDRLRAAAEATARAAAAAFGLAEPGRSERELELAYRTELVTAGAMPGAASWTSGPRTALPNGQASERRLDVGEQVRFDGGCRFELYCADIARTAAVGEPDTRLAERYRAVHAGLEAAIAAVRPGASGGELFAAAIGAVREAGIADYARTHCGHGIGIENYDEPLIAAGVETELEPGMVLCLETPYYELGWGGVQVEDTVLVTDEGVERFTRAAPRP